MKNKDKKMLLFIIATVVTSFGIGYTLLKGTRATTEVPANSAFDDINFYKCVVDAYNKENGTSVGYDTNLSDEQLQTIQKLSCSGFGKSDELKIKSVKGISLLTSLTYAYLSYNKLTEIDVSNNVILEHLWVAENQLTEIDVSSNVALTDFRADGNQLTEIDVSNNVVLSIFDVSENQLTKIDVSKNLTLTSLHVGYNQLTEVDVSNNIALKTLDFMGNQLIEIDVSNNKNLISLYLSNNDLTALDVSNNLVLTSLSAGYNQLTEIDVSDNTALTSLGVSGNQLTEIDVSNNASLTRLDTRDNQLTAIDISNNTSLVRLDARNNQLTEIDIRDKKKLAELDVAENKFTGIDVSNNTALTSLFVDENQLTEIDVSNNIALEMLDVSENQLKELNVSNNVALKRLYVNYNQLTELNVGNNTALITLEVEENQLTGIDVSNNVTLERLMISENPYNEDIYIYNNMTATVGNNVNIASHLNWSEPTWVSNDTNVATVDENGIVTALNNGSVEIVGTLKYKYTTTTTVNVVNITSSRYEINEEKKYIYVGIDNDIDLIKNNIDVSNENVTIDIDLNNYKLYVKYGEQILKEFTIISILSNTCVLADEYIYVGAEQLNDSSIIVNNAEKIISDNKLLIKYDDVVLDEFDLVSVSSDAYDLSNEYIYVETGSLNTANISVVNGDSELNDNKLLVKYGDVILDTFDVVSISSSVYDLTKEYIYVGTGSFNTANVSVVNGDSELDNNKLLIKYGDVILDEFDVVSILPSLYDLTKEYIYLEAGGFNTTNVSVVNGTSTVNNNKLLIKYGDVVLEEFDLVAISSSVYNLTKEYIYVGTESLNTANISVVNGDSEVSNNKLLIKYGDIILEEFDLVAISSSVYDLTKEYIYVGTESLNTANISVVNGISTLDNNKLLIKYGDVVLEEFDLVSISSSVYDLTKEYIYVGTGSFNTANVSVVNGDSELNDNKLLIKYGDVILDEYEIVGLKINNYHVVKNLIVLSVEVPYDEFVSNIIVTDGLTYKLFNNEVEVTDGNVLNEMIFKIYYNDEEVDSYIISDDHIYFDEKINVDDDNSVIGNIDDGSTIDDVLNMIDTNGSIDVLDKDDNILEDTSGKLKTGDKFRINLPSQTMTYTISIAGDVNGDGIITRDDIELSSRHIIKGNLIIGAEYLKATDMDNNNVTNINDIIRMAKKVKGE